MSEHPKDQRFQNVTMSQKKPKNNRIFIGLLSLPLAMNGLLFWLSHRSTLPIDPLFPHFDKVAHFGAYFVLCGLWLLALSWKTPPWSLSRIIILSLVFTIGYGAFDEIHQAFVPGRVASLADLLMDALGAITASEFVRRFAPKGLFPFNPHTS